MRSSSPPPIPPPPPRERKKGRRGGRKERGMATTWLIALGFGVAAGALSYEWITPMSALFDDVVAMLF